MKIAPSQRQELDFLRDTLTALDRMLGKDMRQNFRALQGQLDNWATKVAVIGQVKAGKSTFLNAFLHSHDFLPSDVNPWTSVVTNIRINIPNDPISGARFDFFAESDWEEIVSGDSRIRRLTEELLPGFDTNLLRKQSVEMRERAERRLGRHFQALLGTNHEYDFVTADLLKRYVCAGPGADDGLERESLGRYAALTKVANVYMRQPEFLVPTIITDTPGVNDPFLVRDEFTCRSLDQSDVFVVVLSAHQPLTDVDITLIRILARQDDKDVLVFVNRIDELDDYDRDVPRVLDDVSRRLRGAIPDIDFTIVAGSGYMADLALQEGEDVEAARAKLDDARLARYLKSKHGEIPGDRSDRLLLASGLDEVKAALSSVIDRGVGARKIGQICGDIRAELEGAQFITRRERETLQQQVESISKDVAEMAVQEIEAEIATIRRAQQTIEERVEHTDREVETLLFRAWTGLGAQLTSAIKTFVEQQEGVFRDHILASVERGQAAEAIEIDIAPLFESLEKEVSLAWIRSRRQADAMMTECIRACGQVIATHFHEHVENVTLENIPHDTFSSTLTLARRSLKVDLVDEKGWMFWRKRTVNLDKSIEALHQIVAAEFKTKIEKILAVFNEAQIERATAGSSRIGVMRRMVDTAMTERMRRLRKDMKQMDQIASDPETRTRMIQRLQSEMEVLEHRLINLSSVENVLSRSDLVNAA